VIWTTDHGDGLARAKRELFDSGIHVPMIIRWPPAYRPQGVEPGTVDDRLISFVDLAPTILALAGVKTPADLPGINFASTQTREYVYAARDRIDEVPDRQRAVRDKRYKYLRSWHPSQPGGHALAFRDNADMVLEMQRLYREGRLNAAQRQWFEAPGEERLFDTLSDPFELDNLVRDAAYAETLQRMRGALDAWLAVTPDCSEEPEANMVARFQPHGETPVTPAPSVSFQGGQVVLSASDNASVGYRVDDGAWQVYAAPFVAPTGGRLRAKAVRYGWEESEVVEWTVPEAENADAPVPAG
ncbi:MAG: sulfatase-like hydrolase/transferase, partial [Halioglobus sp.]|nr:sulfatase-like hydrolase/transferase [Halioglobus sp.]